jgi:hypothetical protein
VDVAQGEMVEKELTAFIEKRDKQRRSRKKDPDEQHELWQASVDAYEARRRGERRRRGTAGTSTRPTAIAAPSRP